MAVAEAVSQYAGMALNIGLFIGAIVLIGGLVFLSYLMFDQYKKYRQFTCVIFDKDGFGQWTITKDVAGIFTKKNEKLFWMKKFKVGLNPDQVPYLTDNTSKGFLKTKKTVYLLKTGLKNFRFISFNIVPPGVSLTVGEEDVSWAINTYEAHKNKFSTSLLKELLPWLGLAFVGIVFMVVMIYFFQKLDVLKDLATAMRDVSINIAQAKSGTTVMK